MLQVRGDGALLPLNDPNWTVVNEYDPMWPNEFHKVSKGKCKQSVIFESTFSF